MVDTSTKPETLREARASGLVRMAPARLALIRDRGMAKGDVLEVARLAGILAAKKTGEVIPPCEPTAFARELARALTGGMREEKVPFSRFADFERQLWAVENDLETIEHVTPQ